MSRAERATDQAASWIIARENGGWSDVDQAALDAWLAESDGNKAAYWRLKHSWSEADRIGALGGASDNVHVLEVPDRFARRWRLGALASCLAALVGLGSASGNWTRGPPPTR